MPLEDDLLDSSIQTAPANWPNLIPYPIIPCILEQSGTVSFDHIHKISASATPIDLLSLLKRLTPIQKYGVRDMRHKSPMADQSVANRIRPQGSAPRMYYRT